MIKLCIAFVSFTSGFMTLPVLAQDVPVFTSGAEGYKSFRIPALVRMPSGQLLAFCEGRVKGSGDFGNIDIVLKRSPGVGRPWSALQVVAEFGDEQVCNPAPVVDLTDPAYPQGRIFLFYNTGNNHEGEILKGHGIKLVKYVTSEDQGVTWSKPVDITTQVHRPQQPSVDAAYNFPEDWRYYANTPGHAMQFQQGKYKGRIFVAANHSAGAPQPAAGHYVAHGFYTDDHGKTFKLGDSIKQPGSNESTAVELSGDRLMMNSRNQRGDVRARIVSISNDGGQTWAEPKFDQTLIDPICQGSIAQVGTKDGKPVLGFCNAADTKSRDNLTLRISYDEGVTWPKSIPLAKGPEGGKGSFAAYSDIVALSEREVGVLYERENYQKIVFTMVGWKE